MAEPKKPSYFGRALIGAFEPEYSVAEAHIDLEEILGDMINVSLSLSQLVSFLVKKASLDEGDIADLTQVAEAHQKSMEDLQQRLRKVVSIGKEIDNGRNR